jgi:hypothetical protein
LNEVEDWGFGYFGEEAFAGEGLEFCGEFEVLFGESFVFLLQTDQLVVWLGIGIGYFFDWGWIVHFSTFGVGRCEFFGLESLNILFQVCDLSFALFN